MEKKKVNGTKGKTPYSAENRTKTNQLTTKTTAKPTAKNGRPTGSASKTAEETKKSGNKGKATYNGGNKGKATYSGKAANNGGNKGKATYNGGNKGKTKAANKGENKAKAEWVELKTNGFEMEEEVKTEKKVDERPLNLGIISLGCDKNRVDAEKMIYKLAEAGYNIVHDENVLDVLIINTCAFIDSAKKETIEVILDWIEYKKRHPMKIVVTGCFATRYLEQAMEQFPEVDAFVPIEREIFIVREVNTLFRRPRFLPQVMGRILTTPFWYAYIKIIDGCNNRCSYCAIPYIRGEYKSAEVMSIVYEAYYLRQRGVKELIVVAQDTTVYGIDRYGDYGIVPLLKKFCSLGFWRVRLLYAYPEHISDELIDFIDSEPRMAKYLDIPMQHVSDGLLKSMNRRSTEKGLRELMEKIRSKQNYIAVRSSFITGFPGETEEDNKALCDFVRDNIDYAGFFTFSPEEGTPAYSFPDKVKVSVAKRRKKEAEEAWQIGFKKRQSRLIGQTVEVLCDGIDEEQGAFVGRTEYQTPDVDTKTYFTADFNVVQGEVYKVQITDASFDLWGVATKEDNEIQD